MFTSKPLKCLKLRTACEWGKLTYNRYDILLQIVKVEFASLHFNSLIKTGWKPLVLSCDDVPVFFFFENEMLSPPFCSLPLLPPVSFLARSTPPQIGRGSCLKWVLVLSHYFIFWE